MITPAYLLVYYFYDVGIYSTFCIKTINLGNPRMASEKEKLHILLSIFPNHWDIDLAYIENPSIDQQILLRRLNRTKVVSLPETKNYNSKQMIDEYKNRTKSNEITIKFL